MSEYKMGHGHKELFKVIDGVRVYMNKTWCLRYGVHWSCSVYLKSFATGWGGHKTNRFTAYRRAIADAMASERASYAKYPLVLEEAYRQYDANH